MLERKAGEHLSLGLYIINLERDSARRERALSQTRGLDGFRIEIVRGVPGGSLPASACVKLADDPGWVTQKGALGCFLSHVSAWERISIQAGERAIVLEDDSNFGDLSRLPGIVVPADAEIVFLNNRMCLSEPGEPRVIDMVLALQKPGLCTTGPGGDGYLLTKTGAQKLLATIPHDLFYGHIDGRLLRYATSATDLKAVEGSEMFHILSFHHNPRRLPPLGLLKGYSLSAPLVFHAGLPSSREAETTAA